jgi:hypothetical protein
VPTVSVNPDYCKALLLLATAAPHRPREGVL